MRIQADRLMAFPPIPPEFEELLGGKVTQYINELQSSLTSHLRKLYDSLGMDTDLELSSTNAVYFGEFDTNGSWRIVRSGNDLVIQRRESGTWTTKSTVTP